METEQNLHNMLTTLKREFDEEKNECIDPKKIKIDPALKKIDDMYCNDSVSFSHTGKCRNCKNSTKTFFQIFRYYCSYLVCSECCDNISKSYTTPQQLGLGPLFGTE